MSILGSIIKRRAYYNGSAGDSIVEQMAKEFSRVNVKPAEDFECTYVVSKDGLTIYLKPTSDYGRFVMQKTFDADAKEELDRK